MPRSEEAAAWTYAVYNAVREVPHGKVTSYGHIARLLGKLQGCLSFWLLLCGKQHLTMSRGANGASQQATALEAEGVQVTRGALGEYTIDFTTYGWFPDRLPSDLSSEEEDEE
ncbi:hypothetical protein E4T42_06649 [Aureobasidium subglaciale]|nr:hypothetical protein E4T38_08406 [Aureobasidium subglaciale]KAI5215490.1 hypothetical protein E4T40_08356 [Aureobasidium subglaciale]KAI5218645.1 hypothetical protein E4T41_08270 [Aureobasidium subglaciale]KAI5245894.1 hypothetical protein E4T42_06649 [Aureobasidium subglaciale]KAI5256180.1 hypothetical protein E4T46_08305 [Aureobasidium subglaciale]